MKLAALLAEVSRPRAAAKAATLRNDMLALAQDAAAHIRGGTLICGMLNDQEAFFAVDPEAKPGDKRPFVEHDEGSVDTADLEDRGLKVEYLNMTDSALPTGKALAASLRAVTEAKEPKVLKLRRISHPTDVIVDRESEVIDNLIAAAPGKGLKDFDFGYDAKGERIVAVPKKRRDGGTFLALYVTGPRDGKVPLEGEEWEEIELQPGVAIKFK